MGTPAGSSHSAAIAGSWDAGDVKRELGWAAGVPSSLDHNWPFQSMSPSGGSPMPSHQMSPSGVIAVFVKIVFASIESIALGLVCMLVPGATPKKPASGLMACRRPSASGFIQQMSSPTVSTFQPGRVGTSIARFVLPQALGNAPVTKRDSPAGLVSFRTSMCSASQPSSRANTEAMRSAKHFFPSRALPP